mmetsp:Transcript_20496/g.58796  ORF Transcript_20496/g.58796 Transcript_20496/m.58796 type:complete len:461 (+) Transcript_20496:154-1536(+)
MAASVSAAACVSSYEYFRRPRSLHAAVFVYFVTTGGRFTAPFLKDVAHFTDTVNGLSLAAQVLIDALLGPLAGTLADASERRHPRRKHRGRGLVMTAGVTVGTAAFVLHGVVASVCTEERWSCSPTTTTALHVLLRLLFAVGNAFVYPVLNGITLTFLDDEGCPQSQYGKERLYGAVSWAVASVIVGWAIDVGGGFGVLPFCFAPLGYAVYVASIVAFVGSHESAAVAGFATDDELVTKGCGNRADEFRDDSVDEFRDEPDLDGEETQSQQRQQSTSLLQMLAMACGTIYGVGFFSSMVTLSMGMSIVESLIFLFFEELGGTYTVMGLTVVVTVVFEIPVFHFAPTLLDKFGPGRLQQAAAVSYMVRVIGYTLIPEGAMAWVLLLEPLHGVTYGAAATSNVAYMAQLSPKGYEATSQGLLSGLRGIGSIVGLSCWVAGSTTPMEQRSCTDCMPQSSRLGW